MKFIKLRPWYRVHRGQYIRIGRHAYYVVLSFKRWALVQRASWEVL